MNRMTRWARCAWLVLLLPVSTWCIGADGPSLTGKALVQALQHGGYVILMRHANSPQTPPGPGQVDPENTKHERQLDDAGREAARAMGEAFKRLQIPVGVVWSSPTYRALETVRLAQLPTPQTFDELGDAGKSMSGDASGARGAWLRARVSKPTTQGTDTVVITHYPNIMEVFSKDVSGLGEGEALILKPDGASGASLVGRVKMEEWPQLVAAP